MTSATYAASGMARGSDAWLSPVSSGFGAPVQPSTGTCAVVAQRLSQECTCALAGRHPGARGKVELVAMIAASTLFSSAEAPKRHAQHANDVRLHDGLAAETPQPRPCSPTARSESGDEHIESGKARTTSSARRGNEAGSSRSERIPTMPGGRRDFSSGLPPPDERDAARLAAHALRPERDVCRSFHSLLLAVWVAGGRAFASSWDGRTCGRSSPRQSTEIVRAPGRRGVSHAASSRRTPC